MNESRVPRQVEPTNEFSDAVLTKIETEYDNLRNFRIITLVESVKFRSQVFNRSGITRALNRTPDFPGMLAIEGITVQDMTAGKEWTII